MIYWIPIFLSIGYLWFRLLNNLRLEWMTDPQYSYGLLVPILCLGLLVRRWSTVGNWKSEIGKNYKLAITLFVFLAFLYLPTRLIEAATPEWRPIQWLLGIETIGLTLCAIQAGKGQGWLRQLAFPICFFFVAIPWPTLVEAPIIQTLTRTSAVIVIELLGWVNVPAIAHGNIIQVSTGMVGIDEACSGIRSFQSSLMICLFLGEFYYLRRWRRWFLIPMGFGLSMAFNVGRMFLLTLIAAKKGVAAIHQYHDPAGVTIAVLCTLSLWGLALLLRSKDSVPVAAEAGANPNSVPSVENPNAPFISASHRSSILYRLGLGLLVWLAMVEIGVQVWYQNREARLQTSPVWTLDFSRNNPTLKEIPIDDTTKNLLRFDEGKEATWNETDGTQWQAFYFNWLPGRVAGYLAKRHTPEICLEAVGLKLASGPKLNMVNVNGVDLPIRSYIFKSGNTIIQVFHCRWEAGASKDAYVENESTRYNLVRAIWAGRGNQGQKVLEFVVWGQDDPEQAKQALINQLEQLIKVKKP